MRKYTLAKGGIIAHDARSVDNIESWTASTPSSWTCLLSVLCSTGGPPPYAN